MVLIGTDIKEKNRFDSCRRLAKVSEATYPNEVMTELLNRADNTLKIVTGKTVQWVSTDTDWLTALKISDYIGAIEIMDSLPNKNGDELRTALDKLLGQMNRTDDTIKIPSPIAVSKGINISNELDPAVYTPEQDVYTN